MSQNIFEYLNIISSDTPRLISKADSDQDINDFLQKLIQLNAESNVCVFIVGPFICFIEFMATSNDVTFGLDRAITLLKSKIYLRIRSSKVLTG